MWGVSKTNIAKISIPVPAVSEQRALASILSDMDAEIVAVEAKLVKARHIKQGWFPELAGDLVEILIVHNRMVDFLWNQQLLRLKDPEGWLESDHDSRFLELWSQHRYAIAGVQLKLRSLAHVPRSERDEHQLA